MSLVETYESLMDNPEVYEAELIIRHRHKDGRLQETHYIMEHCNMSLSNIRDKYPIYLMGSAPPQYFSAGPARTKIEISGVGKIQTVKNLPYVPEHPPKIKTDLDERLDNIEF